LLTCVWGIGNLDVSVIKPTVEGIKSVSQKTSVYRRGGQSVCDAADDARAKVIR
jgi:hypothetical protein